MVFDILYVLIMGLVQGLTEWLPVSSSGHLVLAQEFFGVTERTLFDAILHLGTLCAAIVYFHKDIKPLMNPKNPKTHKIILASIPIIIVGVLISDTVEAAFSLTVVVAVLLIINGLVLMVNFFVIKARKGKITTKNGLIIGIFQIFALFPGISRSGTTITTGRVLGIDWKSAAKFSFFISFIPLTGAACFKIATAYSEFEPLYILGFIVAFMVGYASIDIMMKMLQTSKFHYFGVYTIILGIVVLALLL